MPVADFLDTNVLVYAYQFNDRAKQRVGQELVRKALTGKFVISPQVLSEFASTLLHKASPPATPEAMIEILDRLSPIKLVTPDGDLIRRAVEAQASYGLHFYDCLIIAAAERGGCGRIWSEDLNAGQKYFGVSVANPFA
jgi:predicted nucleic acid-binding protein